MRIVYRKSEMDQGRSGTPSWVSSGHDFSRAVNAAETMRLQPLRFGLPCDHKCSAAERQPSGAKAQRAEPLVSAWLKPCPDGLARGSLRLLLMIVAALWLLIPGVLYARKFYPDDPLQTVPPPRPVPSALSRK